MEDFKERKYFSLDLFLVDGNPFFWDATYCGRHGTHLDGEVFSIKIHLSAIPAGTTSSVFQNTHLSPSCFRGRDDVLSY
jgi:hypothetical protein